MRNSFFINPTAVIEKGAIVGKGTKVWHFSHIMTGARIGKDCILGQNTFVAKDVVIGNGVKVQNNVSIYEGVTLEDFVFCGPSVVFTNVINPRSQISRRHEFRVTQVKKGATLGANSTIICGTTIGRFSLIGAGAVITKNVPDYAIMKGVPAKFAGWVCECGEKLDFSQDKAVCDTCRKYYKKTKYQLVRRLK